MDGVSVAASIVGIASAGVQVSIKLVTLATQISTASDRVSAIGNDVSLTSGVLHQLGELMTQKTTDDGVSIFSEGGLQSTRLSAAVCERIFRQVETEAKKASEQLRDCKQGRLTGGKIKLSRAEKAKWPFLQPSVDAMRADLREAKGTLMLMLQVTSLALSKRMADLNEATSSSMSEQRDFIRAIVALQQQQQQQEQRLELRGRNPNGILSNPQKVTNSISPPRPGTADRTRIVDVVRSVENPPMPVNASQTQASLAQTRASLYDPTNFAMALSTGQDMTGKFPTLSPIHLGKDLSRDTRTSSTPRGSFEASKAPSQTTDNEINHQRPDGLCSVQNPARSVSDIHGDGLSAQSIDTELNLFLLKPIVKDFFDKVELSWSVQNTRMQPLAVRKHMANHERERLPSVIEMLHNLHAYEQAMVDLEVSKYPEGSIMSLRRTHTDIRHRDMVFKDIPGLQFVVQHVIRSYSNPEPASGYSGAQFKAQPPALFEQYTAPPMAGCQTCGTRSFFVLSIGGELICNACGHHSWKQQQLRGQQQQPHQNALQSAQQEYSQHVQQPAFDIHGRRATTQANGQPEAFPAFQPEERLGSNDMGQAAQMVPPEINVEYAPKTRQQSFEPPRYKRSDIHALKRPDRGRKGHVRDKSDTNLYSRPVTPSSSHSSQSDLQPQKALWPQVLTQPDHVAAAKVQQQQQQQQQQQMQMHMQDQAEAAPQQQMQAQQQARATPQHQQMRPQQHSYPALPQHRMDQQGEQQQNLHYHSPLTAARLERVNLPEAAAPGHRAAFQSYSQLRSSPLFRKHDAPGRSTKRPRLSAGNEDDKGLVANEDAKGSGMGSTRKRKQDEEELLALPSDESEEEEFVESDVSEAESEESDLDESEGDDVDMDVEAIVKALLGKYTTFFNH